MNIFEYYKDIFLQSMDKKSSSMNFLICILENSGCLLDTITSILFPDSSALTSKLIEIFFGMFFNL